MHKTFSTTASFRHTDIKNQCMNLNNGDNQKLHAAMNAGYQYSTKLTHDSQHALRHE